MRSKAWSLSKSRFIVSAVRAGSYVVCRYGRRPAIHHRDVGCIEAASMPLHILAGSLAAPLNAAIQTEFQVGHRARQSVRCGSCPSAACCWICAFIEDCPTKLPDGGAEDVTVAITRLAPTHRGRRRSRLRRRAWLERQVIRQIIRRKQIS
jgi:hypothetical protein